LQLETVLINAPKQSKRLFDLDQELLNHPAIQALIVKYKRKSAK
jgi:hypothetical protein